MSTAFQLDMFSDFHSVNENIAKYKESSDKVRRGIFARVGELKKEIDPMKEVLQRHEKQIEEMLGMIEKLLASDKVVEFQEAVV